MKKNNHPISERSFHKSSLRTDNFFVKLKTIPAYFILIIALVLSYFAFIIISVNIENQRTTEFNKAVQSIITRVENLKLTELSILSSMHGLYDILPQVTRDYFEIYGSVPLQTYKSISSISYIVTLNEINKNKFIFDQYSVGYYYYEIYPSGSREIYYPVQMLVPFESYEDKFLGFDIKTNPELNSRFERAMNTGRIQCSDFINLPFHNKHVSAFIFAPVFHISPTLENKMDKSKHFDGILALEINMDEFVKEAMRGGSSANKSVFPSDSAVFFDVYEIKDDNSKKLIFSSENKKPNYNVKNAEISSKVIVNLINKKIEFNFYSETFIGGFKQKYLPWLILLLSAIMSFILFVFVRSVIINHSKLETYARKVFRSEKSILDNTLELVISVDHNGQLNLINKSFISTFGIKDEDESITIDKYIVNSEDKIMFNKLLEDHSKGIIKDNILKMKNANGSEILVNWTIVFFEEDKQINLIGRII